MPGHPAREDRALPDFTANRWSPVHEFRPIIGRYTFEQFRHGEPPLAPGFDDQTAVFDPQLDCRSLAKPELLEQRLGNTQADAVAPTMQCDGHSSGALRGRIYIRYPTACGQAPLTVQQRAVLHRGILTHYRIGDR